jgi:hypothetical protein
VLVQLNPRLAKHAIGADVMRRLEANKGGPVAFDIAQLPLEAAHCVAWQRLAPPAAAGALPASQAAGPSASQAGGGGGEPERGALLGPVPLVALLYPTPDAFVTELLRDGLRRELGAAAAAHPRCSLVLLVAGLTPAWMSRREDAEMRAGCTDFSRRRLEDALGRLLAAAPGVRLKRAHDAAAAAEALHELTRAVAAQPYSDPDDFLAARAVGSKAAGGGGLSGGAGVLARALGALPFVAGPNAERIAEVHRSLGGLMDAFADESRRVPPPPPPPARRLLAACSLRAQGVGERRAAGRAAGCVRRMP